MAYYEEASPICRGKNLSWETVLLFYNNMPRTALPKATFHSYVESRINGWTQTHSQIARQLAFYYEQDGMCYPRFTGETTYSDLFLYMQNWASKYFVPNPYAPSLKAYEPVCLYLYLKNSIEQGSTDFDAALDSIFAVKLSSHDKVNVFMSNFTNIVIDGNHQMRINDRIDFPEVKQEMLNDYVSDAKKYFDYFTIRAQNTGKCTLSNLPHQIIFYGAPGTGKSNRIDELTNDGNRIRTTFHPDSDYSTFVGAYKPTMKKTPVYNTTNGELLKEEEQISYSFVAQAFLKAYVEAWTRWGNGNTEPYYLIIEEINRGNCAQIFGDLFQLLDRDGKWKSRYAISPDDDIRKYLSEKFDKCVNIDAKIKNGELMQLPSNLYIWATMNTSDQSLFPIDSAFKRRWDWKYMKIKDAKKGWKIGVETKEGEKLDWWKFVEQINRVIANMTSSADKQLGYFFCKPTECDEQFKPIGLINKNGQEKETSNSIGKTSPNLFVVEVDDLDKEPNIISAETFVSKVVFYLWYDVFKDYGFEDDRLFKYKKTYEDGKEMEEDLTFPAFYKDDDDNSVNEDVVRQFIENVMNWKAEGAGKE